MPNITISIDEDLIRSGREYAKKHNTSLNALIRQLLEQTVRSNSKEWREDCFRLMDKTDADSKGKRWSRQELYDV